jgi:mono/diheme cytochrome c family protein
MRLDATGGVKRQLVAPPLPLMHINAQPRRGNEMARMSHDMEPVSMPPMNSARPGLAAILILASGLAATAQESGDAAAGARFARSACGPCHAIEPGLASSPNADAPAFQVIANMPSMTGTALTVWLRTSHPTMPNLQLTPAETADVIAYIESLRRRRK